jgi:predicted nucleic acid-binding protein
MIAYLDSSVLLRIVLGQARPLKEWATVRRGVASSLVEVECLRTIDRLRPRFAIADRALALRREAVFGLMDMMEVVEPTRAVLTRAAQPLPTELGTLDAIHLATAMAWRELHNADLVMATHDATLGTAACSYGLRVVGIV